jgi:hypothetical protein
VAFVPTYLAQKGWNDNVASHTHCRCGIDQFSRGRTIEAIADKGYYKGEEIVACEKDGISVTVFKPHTSNAAAHGRFVLWGNAARLDESRQERRSDTE